MYERHELLEFFDCDRLICEYDEIVMFYKGLKENFDFRLLIDPLAHSATIRLLHRNIKLPLFDIELRNISKIKLIDEKDQKMLSFYQPLKDTFPYQDAMLYPPYLKMMVYPTVLLQHHLD